MWEINGQFHCDACAKKRLDAIDKVWEEAENER